MNCGRKLDVRYKGDVCALLLTKTSIFTLLPIDCCVSGRRGLCLQSLLAPPMQSSPSASPRPARIPPLALAHQGPRWRAPSLAPSYQTPAQTPVYRVLSLLDRAGVDGLQTEVIAGRRAGRLVVLAHAARVSSNPQRGGGWGTWSSVARRGRPRPAVGGRVFGLLSIPAV